MCCACGGGDWPSSGEVSCTNTNLFATDTDGDDCSYYSGNLWACGVYDQPDNSFASNDMCCVCGGGWVDNSSGPTDTNSNGCSSYVGYTDTCGNNDDVDFTANDICGACVVA